jgi:hypothetical protein
MSRLAILLGAGAVALAAAAPVSATAAAPGRSEFEILMNGKPVGRHSVAVTEAAGVTTARIQIDMAGRVGPIGFTYAHRCEETWRGGALQSLSCTDRENRSSKSVTARRQGGEIAVNGTGFQGAAPLAALPSSWWRAETVRQTQLIDSRDGKMARINATRRGEDTIATSGGPVRATHWRLRGAVNTDVWYDESGRWVKTAFRLAGQSFTYRKLTPVAGAPRS